MKNEKNKSSKKTSTKKTATKKVESVEKTKKIDQVEKTKKLPIVNLTDIREKIHSLEDAYFNAINGKIKFADVKDMFRKLHKEIKSTTKK